MWYIYNVLLCPCMTIILAILEQHVFTSFLSQAFIANYEVYSDWIDRFSLECRKRIGFALQWNPGHQLNKITPILLRTISFVPTKSSYFAGHSVPSDKFWYIVNSAFRRALKKSKVILVWEYWMSIRAYRIDYQPLFGKWARAPLPNALSPNVLLGEGRPDTRERRKLSLTCVRFP